MGNFHPLEVVGRGSETQLQVDENLNFTTKPSSTRMIVDCGKTLIRRQNCVGLYSLHNMIPSSAC